MTPNCAGRELRRPDKPAGECPAPTRGFSVFLAEYDRRAEQRDAVLALHRSDSDYFLDPDRLACVACIAPHEDPVEWPCPTVRAMGVTQ